MRVIILSALALLLSTYQALAVDVTTAENLIAEALKAAGGTSNANNEIRIDLAKGKTTIEDLDTKDLKVTKLEFDRANGSFRAYISANDNLPFETAGRFFETTKVPVLNRKLEKNEVIAKSDIDYLLIDSAKLRNGYITNEAVLIGKAPTRAIYKARPITLSQLMEPKVIERNKRITMVYNLNSLTIKDFGIALESGAVGQVIKFKNANSNKIVSAKIVDENTAKIQSANDQLASN